MRRESWLLLLLFLLVLSLPAGLIAVVNGISLPGDGTLKASWSFAEMQGTPDRRTVTLDNRPAALLTRALVLMDERGNRRIIAVRLILTSHAYITHACAVEARLLDKIRGYLIETPTMIPNDDDRRSRPDKRLNRSLEAVAGPRSIARIDLHHALESFPKHDAPVYSCVSGKVRLGLV